MFRWLKFWWQRRTRGWDDREVWNADLTFAKFILPRLTLFRERIKGCPDTMTMNTWKKSVDDMIFAFNLKVHEGSMPSHRLKEHDVRYLRGLHLFAKHFDYLWL